MIRKIALAVCMMVSITAHSQQTSVDALYSWDTDRTKVSVLSLTGWRFTPSTVDAKVMSWYTTSDIDMHHSGHGQLRLNFQTESPAAAVAMLSRVNFTASAVKLRVRSASWKDVTQFTVIFGSDGIAATQTLTLDVKGQLSNPPNGEWTDIVAPVSGLEKYNAIDLSNVNFVMVRAQGTPGNHVDIATISLAPYQVEPVARSGASVLSTTSVLALPSSTDTEIKLFNPQLDIANNTINNAVDTVAMFNYGAQITALRVENDAGTNRHATDTRLLGKATLGKIAFSGSVGLLDSQSRTTAGSAEVTWRIIDPLVLSIGHARNAIDTVEAMQANIVQDAYTLSADYNTARWGVFAGLADIDYSDGNRRSMVSSKVHMSVWDKIGANAYVRTRHYRNSDPYTGLYFSPENYDRWLAGVAVRTQVAKNSILSGHLDAGRQTTDGDSSLGWTTRLNLESKPNKNWSFKATMGVDQTRPDYRYNYIMGYVSYQ